MRPLRWLYLSIYLIMGAGMVIAIFNPSPDGFVATLLIGASVTLLVLGAEKLESQPPE